MYTGTIKTILALLMLISIKSFSQPARATTTPPLVQVEWETDWGHKIMMHGTDYWTADVIAQLKTQVSDHELEQVKTSTKDMPCSMAVFCGKTMKHSDSLNAKLSRLKMYRIATYTRKEQDGKVAQTMAVLRVPYEGNENWDENATWDTAYFLVPAKYIKEIGPGFVQKKLPEKHCFQQVRIVNAKGVLPFNRQLLEYVYKDDVVVRQIGSKNMTHLNVFFGKPTYPYQFFDSGYKNLKKYNQALGRLTCYKIASFEALDKKTNKPISYVILRIPYKGNENWSANVMWDRNQYESLFLILPATAVKKKASPCIDNLGIDR